MRTPIHASIHSHASRRPHARVAPSADGLVLLLALLLAIVVALLSPAGAWAAWPHDPGADVPVCTASGNERMPVIAPDGAGGAFIAWYDSRSGENKIFAQHLDALGQATWTADGVAVCVVSGAQSNPVVLADGNGGVFVAWEDQRNGYSDVFAQRLGPDGLPRWAAGGLPVCTAANTQRELAIVSDGSGGAILAWEDGRSLTSLDVYAQRIDSTGASQWTADGVAVCVAMNAQYRPQVVGDGAGGAYLAWEDYRNGADYDVYARRVDAAGTPQWAADGVRLCSAPDDQHGPAIAADGAGGVIIAWYDWRSGSQTDVYAQRLTPYGYPAWAANGLVICNAIGHQTSPAIVPDGSGGAIIAWFDQRGSGYAPYAQRVSMGGSCVWPANGLVLGGQTPYGGAPLMVSDGAGGAIVAWEDGRSGTNQEIYAQRVNGSGACLWPAGNPPVSWQPRPQEIAVASDGNGGAIFAWRGTGAEVPLDLFAKRIDRHGKLGNAEAFLAGVEDVPNDQGGQVKVSWAGSYLDADPVYGIAEYRVFRSAPSASFALAARLDRAVTEDSDAAVREGSLLALAGADGAVTYWEYVGTQAAEALAAYSMVAATTSDSVAGSNPPTRFMVEARENTSVSSARWYSAPDSGYSVDNLAPATPSPFTGQYQAGVTLLHWERNSEADLAGYRLYRGTTASFTPSAANLVATPADTGWADAAGVPYFYKITAVDVHGNESPAAALSPAGTLDVPAGGAAELEFAPVAPQPVRGDARLDFSLPAPGAVRIEVFDVTGRRVAVPVDGAFAAGRHSVSWRASGGEGSLAAGVYHVRLSAAGRTTTRRMVVAR